MTLLTGSRHFGDEDLIRYMDHQLDREAMRLAGAHLRNCAACQARLEALQQTSARVSEFLASLDETPDAGRRAAAQGAMERARFRRSASGPMGLTWMRAAAVIVLFIGGVLATEQGRAWVARGILGAAGRDPGPVPTRLVEWLGQRRQLDGSLAAAGSARSRTGNVAADRVADAEPRQTGKTGMSAPVRFDPQGPDVVLVFATPQEVGSAVLHIGEVDAGRAQAVAGYGGERLVATQQGLEVRNRASSQADYEIQVPARFRFIRVRVGDTPESIIRITKSKQDWLWTIPLQTRGLQR